MNSLRMDSPQILPQETPSVIASMGQRWMTAIFVRTAMSPAKSVMNLSVWNVSRIGSSMEEF